MPDTVVISADGHIDVNWLPTDIFLEAAPASLKERVPRLGKSPDGTVWTVKGQPVFAQWAWGKVPGDGPNFKRMADEGLFSDAGKGLLRPTTPALRLKDQERDGLSGEVLYGILGLDRLLEDDREALQFCYRVYSDWAAEFCKAAPERFAAIVPLSSDDADQAAAELRYAASVGLKGGEVRPGGAVKPFWHDYWKPLWLAAEETGLPLHFHSDIGRLQSQGSAEDRAAYAPVLRALIGSIGKMGNAEHLGSMVLSGVLERHPKLTLVMGECDLSWIPHFLARMDYVVTEREHSTGLKLKPSEYWHRQCLATFQSDEIGMELLHHLGADNVMWGNDYPHPDGVWPISQQVLAAQTKALSDVDRRKVTHDNAVRVYGIHGAS